LPSLITTGSDGNLSLRQNRTGVVIAPESEVEIPATAGDGQLIARMIQHRGQAFYDVEPRPIEKLRIETPFMVAVVKGTQFSVAIGDEQTTISLFEGLLELRSIDDQQVIEISAGEIAVGSIATGIRVVPMDPDLAEESIAALIGAGAEREGSTVAVIRSVGATTNVDAADSILDAAINSDPGTETLTARLDIGAARIDTGLRAGLSVGAPQGPLTGVVSVGLDTNLDVGTDLGGAGVDVGLDTGLDVGADLGGGDVSVGLDTGLDVSADLGGGDVSVGLDTNLDVGTDLGGAGVDVGLDTGLDVGADLGGGDISVGLDTNLDVGGDLGGGVDVGLDVGLDAGLDGGLDIAAELEVGGLDLDVGLDSLLDLGEDTDAGSDAGDSEDSETDSLLEDLLPSLF
jgi:hypothetical protein